MIQIHLWSLKTLLLPKCLLIVALWSKNPQKDRVKIEKSNDLSRCSMIPKHLDLLVGKNFSLRERYKFFNLETKISPGKNSIK